MRVEKDFKEFIELLNKHEVEYLIIGGFAYAIHAIPKYTKDIDILINHTSENASRMMKVIENFGLKSIGLTESDFINPDNIIQLGVEPIRIDIITSLGSLSFQSIWDNKIQVNYGGTKCYFISKQDLIKNKLEVGRPQDLIDVEILRKINNYQ